MYPFLVYVESGESGLPKDCCVNLAQIMTIDKSRLNDKCGQLSRQKMNEVDEAIRKSLALEQELSETQKGGKF